MAIHRDSFAFTLLLGALAGLPALSIDMSLPGLPDMQRELAARPAEVMLSLSWFMLGFGGAQLVIGPWSDRVGRRKALAVAMLLYVAGGVVATLAPWWQVLVAGRTVQGTGAAGGTVLAFAIVRDLFDGEAARARLSTISLVFSLAPVIAPTLGGAVLALAGWRGIFGFQVLAGVALLTVMCLGLPESRRPLPPPRRSAILHKTRTLGFGLVGALNLGNVFCFVGGAPLVLLGTFHLGTAEFAAIFAVVTGGVIGGAGLNRLAVRKGWHAAWPLGVGLGGALLGALAGLLAGSDITLVLLLPIFLLTTLSRGLVSPNITHAALERIPHMAGAGSALIGAMQMLTGALAGFIVGLMFDRFGPAGVLMTMAGFGLPAFVAWIFVERTCR
jgi:DHA1 family bicyclomycin/chloramphenicol resistance-like MFS transporter